MEVSDHEIGRMQHDVDRRLRQKEAADATADEHRNEAESEQGSAVNAELLSALIVLDRNLNITSANRAFYQTFRTSRAETEGCHIYDLGNRQWDIPALRTLLESVIPHRASVEGFEVEHDFPTIGQRTMLVNARKIFRPGDHDGFILLAIEDVSEERAARKESGATGN